MIRTSRMSGTSTSVVVPSASSDAAISFSALFFAPGTRTSPSRRAPPTTRNASIRPILGSAGAGTADGHGPTPPGYPGRMVNLTRIYTRTGDDGTTSLGDFSRTRKTDPRLVAYADVDE